MVTMVRHYVKKTNYGQWDVENMHKALRAVIDGKMSCYKASKTYKVPQSTLERRVAAAKTGVANIQGKTVNGNEDLISDSESVAPMEMKGRSAHSTFSSGNSSASNDDIDFSLIDESLKNTAGDESKQFRIEKVMVKREAADEIVFEDSSNNDGLLSNAGGKSETFLRDVSSSIAEVASEAIEAENSVVQKEGAVDGIDGGCMFPDSADRNELSNHSGGSSNTNEFEYVDVKVEPYEADEWITDQETMDQGIPDQGITDQGIIYQEITDQGITYQEITDPEITDQGTTDQEITDQIPVSNNVRYVSTEMNLVAGSTGKEDLVNSLNSNFSKYSKYSVNVTPRANYNCPQPMNFKQRQFSLPIKNSCTAKKRTSYPVTNDARNQKISDQLSSVKRVKVEPDDDEIEIESHGIEIESHEIESESHGIESKSPGIEIESHGIENATSVNISASQVTDSGTVDSKGVETETKGQGEMVKKSVEKKPALKNSRVIPLTLGELRWLRLSEIVDKKLSMDHDLSTSFIIYYHNVLTLNHQMPDSLRDELFKISDLAMIAETDIKVTGSSKPFLPFFPIYHTKAPTAKKRLICLAKCNVELMKSICIINNNKRLDLLLLLANKTYIITGHVPEKFSRIVLSKKLSLLMKLVPPDTNLVLVGNFNLNGFDREDREFIFETLEGFKVSNALGHKITVRDGSQLGIIFTNVRPHQTIVHDRVYSFHYPILIKMPKFFMTPSKS